MSLSRGWTEIADIGQDYSRKAPTRANRSSLLVQSTTHSPISANRSVSSIVSRSRAKELVAEINPSRLHHRGRRVRWKLGVGAGVISFWPGRTGGRITWGCPRFKYPCAHRERDPAVTCDAVTVVIKPLPLSLFLYHHHFTTPRPQSTRTECHPQTLAEPNEASSGFYLGL